MSTATPIEDKNSVPVDLVDIISTTPNFSAPEDDLNLPNPLTYRDKHNTVSGGTLPYIASTDDLRIDISNAKKVIVHRALQVIQDKRIEMSTLKDATKVLIDIENTLEDDGAGQLEQFLTEYNFTIED